MAETVRVRNPILRGFHPDPSICTANGEYFIANSTFEWYPGVEINRSRDLAHWKSVPSPLSSARLLDMAGNKASCGIWAPCLSHSGGKFWLVFTNVRNWNFGTMKDCPNFLTTAENIEGPWSDPIFLNASGFDASMFHDDDGRHYLLNMEWDYRAAGPRCFSGILLQEYSEAKHRLIGKRKKIFLGTDIGLVEGPHLYKQNGYYYLAAAEGGTGYHHALTAARSKKIDGPYEVSPFNPLISSYGHAELKLQKAGHGSWCASLDGTKTYLVYLCARPLPGREDCVLGRETGLAEIKWIDDWPRVMQQDGTFSNTPPECVDVDAETKGQSFSSQGRVHYAFDGDCKELWRDFKTLRVPINKKRYYTANGRLRMAGGQSPWSCFEQGILARRQTDFRFEAETKIFFEPDYFQQYAGLCYRYDEETQYLLQVTYDETLGKILQVNTIMPNSLTRGMPVRLPKGPVWMRLSVDMDNASFSWSLDGNVYHNIRPIVDAGKLSDEYAGEGFTGAFVGMFCVDTEHYSKTADFEYFDYNGHDSE